jgi:hypothetical protein
MYRRSVNSAVCCLVVGMGVLSLLADKASGDAINVLSQVHAAVGYVQDVSYSVLDTTPVSGSCSKTIGTDFVQMTSDTLGSDVGGLHVYAHALSEEDYLYQQGAFAAVAYVFRPNVTPLTIDFSGMSGFHSFESGLVYTLQDLTTLSPLDTKSWEYESGVGWVDDVLPYQGIYEMDASHAYLITIGAYAHLGDQREGFAQLAAIFAPELGSGALLVLGVSAAALLRRRLGLFRSQ